MEKFIAKVLWKTKLGDWLAVVGVEIRRRQTIQMWEEIGEEAHSL